MERSLVLEFFGIREKEAEGMERILGNGAEFESRNPKSYWNHQPYCNSKVMGDNYLLIGDFRQAG